MANTKSPFFRYNILDYCFRNCAFNFNELLDYVNQRIIDSNKGGTIRKSQLKEDLRIFRSTEEGKGFAAPLPPRITIYRYSDQNFSIAQSKLLEEEQKIIEAAQLLLERFDNHPKYNKLSEALMKFEEEENISEINQKILFYDNNDEYKGVSHLRPMYLAIKNKNVLKVIYKPFQKEVIEFEFHPYILKQYNRRWFVFGFNKTKNKKEWSIPLDDRLVNYEVFEATEYQNSDTNWEEFFSELVGVTKPQYSKAEHILLRFYNGREEFFKTKPLLANFDESFENDNEVFFKAVINKELISQILLYGKDVEVLEPKVLRDSIEEHIKTMITNYKL